MQTPTQSNLFSFKMGDGNRTRFTAGDVKVNCDVGLGLKSESAQYYQASAGGVMGASGKVLFTATQWQELERQNKIYMYIMASVPIPPQLLSPSSVQSNRVSTGLRFSNGSDPEPWRCRRTDGKKWRCAKDVAPDQKYCERHVHKTRSRSRKPVETQLHNIKEHHNQQTRFMKNGTVPVSQTNNQFQLPLQSVNGGSRKDHIVKQEFKGNHLQSSCLDLNNHFLNSGGGTDWSRLGGGDGCSLTLSMQSGANDIEFDHESFQMAVGMLRGDKEGCGDGFKPGHQWLNQVSWAGSGGAPGGPLGEALCLGMASSQSESYSHGYSYSTTTSGSCDGDGGHGLDFNFVNPHDG